MEDPHRELCRLADYLGRFAQDTWTFDPTLPTVDRPSAANYRRTPVLPPDQRLESWVDVVPRPSVERAVALLEELGSMCLRGDGPSLRGRRRCAAGWPGEGQGNRSG